MLLQPYCTCTLINDIPVKWNYLQSMQNFAILYVW